jgi:hypothetical protein
VDSEHPRHADKGDCHFVQKLRNAHRNLGLKSNTRFASAQKTHDALCPYVAMGFYRTIGTCRKEPGG